MDRATNNDELAPTVEVPESAIEKGAVIVGSDGRQYRVVRVVSNAERNRRKRRRQKLRGSRKSQSRGTK